MAFGVLFVLLMAVSVWWLYSRWSDLRDAQARRREAEMLFVFEASKRAERPVSASTADASTTFRPTFPGER